VTVGNPAFTRERVLVVDDEPDNRRVLERILERRGYRPATAEDAPGARAALALQDFDLILCDVNLPGESGLDLVEWALPAHPHLAAVMVSGLDDVELADRALAIGAYGYIVKPFSANDVLMRVRAALSHRRREVDALEELRRSQEETVQRLAIAVEARDSETAAHVSDMSELCERVALRLGVSKERAAVMRTAATMHDVGKIAVADRILLKPGRLTPREREAMQDHAEVGYRILSGSSAELLRLAATIAWTHHERVDGSGYPRGLSGDVIPVEGRIAAVADVFDAVTRDRVYRPRMRFDEAVALIRDGRGTHFDPQSADALLETVTAPAG
jgi:putative two-component system response regulator